MSNESPETGRCFTKKSNRGQGMGTKREPPLYPPQFRRFEKPPGSNTPPHIYEVFCDRGSTSRQNCFLNDGVPEPKIVRMSILFRKIISLFTWAMGLFTGMRFDFAEVGFRVGYGSPQVRSLRKNRVTLYHRTPQ